MAGGRHDLTPLQHDVLRAFFDRDRGFFLSGGAALVGFYLHHRDTTDLDLFCTDDDAFARGRLALGGAVATIGGALEVVQDAPDFKRFSVSRGDELVIVDLVRDRVPQGRDAKNEIDGILVDPIEEIVANKLTAVVGRMEERDLVDLFLLEKAGYRVEDFLAAALAKDGGCTPATLAWLLSEVRIPSTSRLPGDVGAAELAQWIASLIVRLRRAAAPR
jgi:hypothetical protein